MSTRIPNDSSSSSDDDDVRFFAARDIRVPPPSSSPHSRRSTPPPPPPVTSSSIEISFEINARVNIELPRHGIHLARTMMDSDGWREGSSFGGY